MMWLTVCREEGGVPPQIDNVLLGRRRPNRRADQNLQNSRRGRV